MGAEHIEFKGTEIPITFLKNAKRFETPKYQSILKFIQKRNIPQRPWKKVLKWFFEENRIPVDEKMAIERIQVSKSNRILCVETGKSRKTFQELRYIAKNTGWYFYLTGVKLGDSIVSETVDEVGRKFDPEAVFEKIVLDGSDGIGLHCLCEGPNRTSHLLELGGTSILLDAGIVEESNWDYFRNLELENLDVLFLSHSHYDHCRGLERILEDYPEIPILCSATTLDFYAFRNSTKPWEKKDDSFHLSDHARHVVQNAITIGSGETARCGEGSLAFHNAGHMPGALMLHVDSPDYDFVYTGDFCVNDFFPIQGVGSIRDQLPGDIDFLLMEAAMGATQHEPVGKMFGALFRRLKLKADYGNRVLIAAQPDSVAIVLYLSLFSYFRKQQLRYGYEKRPLLVLGRETQEYARIIQNRIEDVHPAIRKRIKKKLNPFSSAIARFCEEGSEVFSYLGKRNTIFIFGPPDLSHGIVQDLMESISSYRHNLIYLAGALRNEAALDFVHGQDRIALDVHRIENEAEVFNRRHPNKVLSLHADLNQMIDLVRWLKPRNVGLFHNSFDDLIEVSGYLDRMRHVKSVIALSEDRRLQTLR